MIGPGLMAEQIHLRDQPDLVLPARGNQFLHIGFGERPAPDQLGMAGELIVVIHLQYQCVDSPGRELLVNELNKLVHLRSRRRADVEPAHRQGAIRWLRRVREHNQRAEQ